MATWGPSRGKSKRISTPSSGSAPRPTATAPKTAVTPANAGSGKRTQAATELRGAVEGREHEFLGIGLIVLGAILALAIYFGIAGVLGRGTSELFGWITGIARF